MNQGLLLHTVSMLDAKPKAAPTPAPAAKSVDVSVDVSGVTACVVDNGASVELAIALADSYKKVNYVCSSREEFQRITRARVGEGFKQLNIVESPLAVFDETDLFIYPDVGYGDDQVFLQRCGKRVWGSRKAEVLEQDRGHTKALMKKAGLDVGQYVEITGVTKLEEHLKTHKDVWVKLSKWRGHVESFHATSFQMVKPLIDEMRMDLGPFADSDSIKFIVEQPLPDMVEWGIDTYLVNGEVPDRVLCGAEIKDMGYVGEVMPYAKVPEPVRRFSQTFQPFFKKHGYCGTYSDETRTDGKRAYTIDITARFPSPPGHCYPGLYENLPEIIYQGAAGIMVQPKFRARYIATLIIRSPWAEQKFQPVYFPKKSEPYVWLKNVMKDKDGVDHVIPQQPTGMVEIGSVYGLGDTLDAAMEMAVEVGKTVEGYAIELPNEALNKAKEEIAKAKGFGLEVM